MILRRDFYKANTKLTPYWLKIPIYGVKGGINVPIKTHEPITDDMVCREAKIVRRKGEWFVYITVEKEVQERNPKSVLAVAYRALKRLGHKERQVVNGILHKTSRTIANEALKNNSMIVPGKLKGIRRNSKGENSTEKTKQRIPNP